MTREWIQDSKFNIQNWLKPEVGNQPASYFYAGPGKLFRLPPPYKTLEDREGC